MEKIHENIKKLRRHGGKAVIDREATLGNLRKRGQKTTEKTASKHKVIKLKTKKGGSGLKLLGVGARIFRGLE